MKREYDIYIVDPSDGHLVLPEDWAETEDPTAAELVAVVDHETGEGLLVCKDVLTNDDEPETGWYDYYGAREASKCYSPAMPEGAQFDCPSRAEAVMIYDARFQGLEDAIELLDGCPVEEFACWTCEKDDDPEGGDFAFLFYGSNGGIGSFETGATVSVRPVAKIKTK